MRSRSLFFTLIICLGSTILVHAQALEEETGFKYVKGNYLFDNGRFDEAIQIYNDIVKGSPDFEEVLIYRARAKYALAAYKGAKKDGLKYIELNGLNEEVCLVMGKAELGLGNPRVAITYLDYCISQNKSNSDALLFRGNAFFEIEDDVAACTDWHKAKRLGSDRAEQNTRTYCKRVAIPIEDEAKREERVEDNGDDVLDDGEVISSRTEEESDDDVISGDEVLSTDDLEESDDPVEDDPVDSTSEDDYIFENSDDDLDAEFPEEEPVFDEPLDIVVEIVEIDEDLDIKLYDGIGSRKVREVPDILILSDKAGQVVVDVCVDESGNVSNATLNRKQSTVGSAGLISLALRKSREFKFERKRNGEQCGKIAFLIK